MQYIGYRIPESLIMLVGNDKDQIINTIDYYRNQRGSKIGAASVEDMFDVDSLRIECVFSMCCIDHFINLEVDDVKFRINANAFSYVKSKVLDYSKLRRGEMYKFSPGLMSGGPYGLVSLYYLPENVMRGLKDHDWSVHDKQIESWISSREKLLDGMVNTGGLERHVHLGVLEKKKPDYGKN